MRRGVSQPSSGTRQSTDTDTSNDVIQTSNSGQTVDPSQQVQSSEGETSNSVTETNDPSGSTPESTSSGIPENTGKSTSSEQADGSNQQVPSGETESAGAGKSSRAHQSANNASDNDEVEDLKRLLQEILENELKPMDATISLEGDGIRELIDRAASQNKTQKPVNRRPEDSSLECRSRPRRSKLSTSRKDSRSNQSEGASAISPEEIVENAIRNHNDALVHNPALRITRNTKKVGTLVIKTTDTLAGLLAECQSSAEMRAMLERLATQEPTSGDPNSEDRQNDTQNDSQNDRREVRGRGKQTLPKDIPPRGGGAGGGKK